jgi:hypothetical protein
MLDKYSYSGKKIYATQIFEKAVNLIDATVNKQTQKKGSFVQTSSKTLSFAEQLVSTGTKYAMFSAHDS